MKIISLAKLRILTLISVFFMPICANLCVKITSKKLGKLADAENFYETDYGKINYSVCGEGEPVILVHALGVGFSKFEFEKCAKLLSKNYKVFSIDLLGFGCSEKPDIIYSSYLYVKIINSFIRDIVKESVHFIGNSQSASFGVYAFSHEKRNFKTLTLVNPTEFVKNNFKHSLYLFLLKIPMFNTSVYNMISCKFYAKYYLKKFCFSNVNYVSDFNFNKFYISSHFGGTNNKNMLSSLFSNEFIFPISEKLLKVDIPVTIICGKDNNISSFSKIEEIISKNNNINLYTIENSKIFPHFENTNLFCKIINKTVNIDK